MQLVTDLVLPHLPVETPAFDEDPSPFLKAARQQHPWLAKVNEGYFVHGFQAVKDLSGMDDKLRPAFDGVVAYYGAQDTAWGKWMMEHIIAIWGPKHTRIRSSIASAFTPRNVNRFRGLMRERISDLLDEWVPKGKFDFVDFASDFPISIMCGMLGTSTEAIPRIREALEAQGRSFSLNKELVPEFLAGFEVMWDYVDNLVIEREKSGRMGEDTLLDSLIATKNAGQIDETELRYLLLVLFPAGYDTSRNFLAYTIHTLLSYPEYWERCAADLDFAGKVVEEMLRYNAISTAFRTVAEEFVYNDVKFPKDTWLFIGNSVAGRDTGAIADADTFNPEQAKADRHVAFGRGAHICVGQHMARAQLTEALHMITQRIKNPRLVGDVKWRLFLGTRGPVNLPLEFEPAPARN